MRSSRNETSRPDRGLRAFEVGAATSDPAKGVVIRTRRDFRRTQRLRPAIRHGKVWPNELDLPDDDHDGRPGGAAGASVRGRLEGGESSCSRASWRGCAGPKGDG